MSIPAQRNPSIAVTLRSKLNSTIFEAYPGERLLFAGLRAGLALSYECASGACASCQALPLSPEAGALENLYPAARAGKSLRSGRILMCQTACHKDVELQVFARVAPLQEQEQTPKYLSGFISSIAEVAPNTFAFSVETGEPAAFQAGQFAMLSVKGVAGFRAYSMTNAPGRSTTLDFVIRVVPEGSFSAWIRGESRLGETVRIFGPLGRAILAPDESKDVVAIAGGTGVAGMISMIDDALTKGYLDNQRFTLVFGVRTVEHAFFLERLSRAVSQSHGKLEVILAISESSAAPSWNYPNVNVMHGLVVDVANSVLQGRPEARRSAYFLAGPPIVVDSGLSMLTERHQVDSRSVRFDRFE